MPITKEQIKEIGNYILNGLDEEESCLLSNVNFAEFKDLKNENELVNSFIEKKKVKFKYNHLQEIQSRKSEKNSQWLLEKLRPEEFGPKIGRAQPQVVNIVQQIIKSIQNDPQQSIITESRTRYQQLGEEDTDNGTLTVSNLLN